MTTRTLKRPLALVLALALLPALLPTLSCKDSDSVVRVAVEGAAGVPAVASLRALLSNAGTTDTKLYPQSASASGALTLPTAFTVTIAHQRTGSLDIALDGLDAQGSAVASGAGTVVLQPGGTVAVTITLAAGASLCGNGVLDSGEQCDDGDRFTNGTCDFLCRRQTGAGGAGGTASGGAVGNPGTGGHPSGGTGGTAGTTGTGGAAGATGGGGRAAGGAPGTGGVTSTGGNTGVGTGGVTGPGTGGVRGSGGAASGGSGTGGAGSGGRGSGGMVGAGGALGSGGVNAGGGAPASGGVTGTAGAPGTGGVIATGGTTGAGGSGTACSGELLANGGFEQGGANWTATSATGSAIIYNGNDAGLKALAVTPASGEYLAWLGRDLADGQEDLLSSQPIDLSSQASGLLLQGLARISLAAGSSCQTNCMPTVSIEVQNGTAVQVIKAWTPADVSNGWAGFSVAIDEGVLVNGSILRLRLMIQNGVTFNVFFDQLSLQARFCN